MYLYSNQPRHVGDFARVVTETNVDPGKVVRFLEEIQPEMLPVLDERVRAAKPPPPPARPKTAIASDPAQRLNLQPAHARVFSAPGL
jgi:hypothetical protein